MKCRNITCTLQAVGFVRIHHVYDDGEGEVLDADWQYCYRHFATHRKNYARSKLDLEFHDDMEGFRQ